MTRTLIAIPCLDMVHTEFCRSLARLHTVGEIHHSFVQCSLVYTSRKQLCRTAMESGADYVLWLDSDMVFEPTLMEELMKDMEGRDIVSAMYFARKPPYRPVILKTLEKTLGGGNVEHYDDYPTDGIFEIAGCGFGCVMMRTNVIRQMAEIFSDTFGPIPGFGEDFSFCLRAKTMGVKMYADPKIIVGHCGGMIVTQDTYRAFTSQPGFDMTKYGK